MLIDRQLVVIETQQMQDRGVPVRDADAILNGGKTKLIGRTVGQPRLDTAPGKPAAGGILIVIAA